MSGKEERCVSGKGSKSSDVILDDYHNFLIIVYFALSLWQCTLSVDYKYGACCIICFYCAATNILLKHSMLQLCSISDCFISVTGPFLVRSNVLLSHG